MGSERRGTPFAWALSSLLVVSCNGKYAGVLVRPSMAGGAPAWSASAWFAPDSWFAPASRREEIQAESPEQQRGPIRGGADLGRWQVPWGARLGPGCLCLLSGSLLTPPSLEGGECGGARGPARQRYMWYSTLISEGFLLPEPRLYGLFVSPCSWPADVTYPDLPADLA